MFVGSYTRNRASLREDQPPVSLRDKSLYVNNFCLSNTSPRKLLLLEGGRISVVMYGVDLVQVFCAKRYGVGCF